MFMGEVKIKKASLILIIIIFGLGLVLNINISSASTIQTSEISSNGNSDQNTTYKTLSTDSKTVASQDLNDVQKNEVSADSDIQNTSDIAITQKASNYNPNYLKYVVFTVTVKNNGPNNVSSLNISYPLNKYYLKWISDDANGKYNHLTGIWTINNFNNGSSIVFNVVEQVKTYDKTFTTRASYNSGSFIDPYTVNNFSEINLTIPRASDLTVSQSTAKYFIKYLHTFVLTLTVKNNGPSTAQNVSVNCGLDQNIYGHVSHSSNRNYKPSTSNWTIGYLKSGSTITLHILVKMLAFNSVVSNTVSVYSDTYDYNKSHNRAKILIKTPSLTIKSLASSLSLGTKSRYQRAVNIVNWVRDNIVYSFYYNTKYGAAGTLKKLKGNCADTAHLVVALARVSGFSARYKHGTCYFIKSKHWYGHVWASIFVNGKWYSADATGYKNTLGVIKNWDTSSYTLHGTYNTLPF